uniref:E3 ubiquitin-protein ligase Midline-1-like isoform X1 n=2 Tax=Pristiophorus japonicus TaxID=55135 RepID=UPI00398EBEC2
MNEEPLKIFCDFCLESPLPAVKTCMNCEASLCEHHLRKHSEKAAQKNHLLIEPASSLEDRKCSDHEKLIEYYCLDDHSCICVTCYVAGPHKNHDIRILKDIHNETKASLSEKLEKLQNCRTTLEEATKELQGTEVNLKKDSAILRKQISDLFQEIRMLLTKQEKQILDTVITEKNINLSKVLKKIQELEIKREVITHLIQEVQDLKNQKDPLFFIKDFKSTYERISNNNTEVEKLKVSWKKLDVTTISTIKQETKRIFEMLNTLIFDHPVQSNDEVLEDRFQLEDENEEENLPDSMKPVGSGDIRRTQYTSLFCKDVPIPLVLERPARSSIKITTRGAQEASQSPPPQERSMQLATSEQAVVAQLVEETVSRPSARLPMSQGVMQERSRSDDYDEEDTLTENLYRRRHRCEFKEYFRRGEDSESTISTTDTLVYYAEFEEEGGEMPYLMEDSLDEEYLDVLYMRKQRDKFTTKSV